MSFRMHALGLTSLIWLFSSAAEAQTVQAKNVPVEAAGTKLPVKIGETVWVTVAQGWELKGRVTAFTPTTIEINNETKTQQLNVTEIRRIAKPDSLKNGFLIGAAVGVLSGVGYTVDAMNPKASGGAKAGFAVFNIAIGVGIYGSLGRWLDKRSEGRQTIYEKPAPSTNVEVRPIVSRRGLGLGGSIRW